MFLLIPAHLGCPGQNPESRIMIVCACVCACMRECEVMTCDPDFIFSLFLSLHVSYRCLPCILTFSLFKCIFSFTVILCVCVVLH